ncbi:MAG: hypothetical protein NC311_04350 [Muribaculaceae bacterium]|nr:hypothetical protein [Muribaculaceae bacterium]
MKSVSRFLLIALALVSVGAHASPVATTAGSNLTGYNPGFGANNNNTWNSLTNPRSNIVNTAPTADFGNCNALILRCAQPKCSSGGCTDMDVTSAIVSGCVNSNDTCKQYGPDLVNYISGQLVAQSTAKSNAAVTAAQNAAAQQNSQQMAAMQQQMAQLQQQIDDSNANMAAALEAQASITAQAIASAAAAAQPAPSVSSASDTSNTDSVSVNTDVTTAQRIAAESGVSEELLMREQISGQILSQIENAEKSLETLHETMRAVFDYAGCDSRGDNCAGPKRVTKFKELANKFFDPYEDVLDDLYEAILLAQTVGVDVSNIYMMLNNSCERWGKYACSKPEYYVTNKDGKPVYAWPRYDSTNCVDGKSKPGVPYKTLFGASAGSVKGGQECYVGQTIPPEDDTSCTLIEVLSSNDEELSRSYLYPDEGDMGDMVRVGCASNALKGSWLFRGKKQQATIDIETLQRIIDQDNSKIGFTRQSGNSLGQSEQLKYCALTESGYMNLQKYVGMRGLPKKNICINERKLNQSMNGVYVGLSDSILQQAQQECEYKSDGSASGCAFSTVTYTCYRKGSDGKNTSADKCDDGESKKAKSAAEARICGQYTGATYNVSTSGTNAYSDGTCDCKTTYPDDKFWCEMKFDMPTSTSTPQNGGSGKTYPWSSINWQHVPAPQAMCGKSGIYAQCTWTTFNGTEGCYCPEEK